MALLDESKDNIPLETGFDDPVYESQIVFRKILKVMSEPGTIKKIKNKLSAPAPMMKATAAVCLTLMDFQTKTNMFQKLTMIINLIETQLLQFFLVLHSIKEF